MMTIYTLRDHIRTILQHHPECHVERHELRRALDGCYTVTREGQRPMRVADLGGPSEGFYLASETGEVAVFRRNP